MQVSKVTATEATSIYIYSSVIRQKSESQNGGNKT